MTAQVRERLELDGKVEGMAFCPPIPDDHPRIRPATETESASAPMIVHSTACWRGYVGTWAVRDDRLYLVRMSGRLKVVGDEPIFADWFTGVLRVPRGEMLQYVHMGFGSVQEEELHLKVERGVVVKTRVIDNRGKDVDRWEEGWKNLPGGENRFDGDDW